MMFRESVSLKPLIDQPERRAILGAQSRLKTDRGQEHELAKSVSHLAKCDVLETWGIG